MKLNIILPYDLAFALLGTDIPYLVALYFVILHQQCFFLSFFVFFFHKLKVFKKIEGNPTLSKSISKLHLLTSHLGVTFCEFLQYLNFFRYYYILYLL